VSDAVVNAFYKAHLNSPLAPEVGSGMSGPSTLPADQLVPPNPSPSPSPSPSSTKK
jgi:hypothetical protein